MNVFIVFAHHEPQSFNGALLRQAQRVLGEAGHTVRVSDLHAMRFDPVSDRRNFTGAKDAAYLKQQQEELHASRTDGFAPDVKAEIEKLFWCDALLFQFPLWWYGLPAILKGWCDRVLAMGVIYGGGKWYDDGAFQGRRAMLSLTTGGGPGMFDPQGLAGDLDMLLYPVNHGILRFVGFDVLPPFVAWGPARAGEEQRAAYLEQFGRRLTTLWDTRPIAYPALSEYEKGTWVRKE